MKRSNPLPVFTAFCIFGLFGCTPNESITEQMNSFIIKVQAEAVLPQAATRIPVEEGYKTVFKGGEQIGITALKNGIIYHGMDNVPFTYNAATNAWQLSNNTLPQLYYYPDVTYIAYYPYDAAMSGKKSEQEIIDAFTPQTDQSTYEAYTASDLMTATGTATGSNGAYTLTFNLQHRMSMIATTAEGKRFVSSDGYNYTSNIADFALTLNGNESVKPYNIAIGMYRYLISPAPTTPTKVKVDFLASLNSPVTCEINYSGLSSGKYYNAHITSGNKPPETRDVAIGDFFYSNGTFYPGEADNPPKENCIGVVYNLVDITQEDPLLKAQNSPFTHGQIVSIHEYVPIQWSAINANINSWTNSDERGGMKVNIAESNKLQGYSNTIALKAYCDASSDKEYARAKPIQYIINHEKEHPSPINTTHWYCPSIRDLSVLCWGQGNVSGVAGRNRMEQQFAKVNGTDFYLNPGRHLSSTEPTNYQNLYIKFTTGTKHQNDKRNADSALRPILAF